VALVFLWEEKAEGEKKAAFQFETRRSSAAATVLGACIEKFQTVGMYKSTWKPLKWKIGAELHQDFFVYSSPD
jgi:hypothetical protein